jgi:hypothetical protein
MHRREPVDHLRSPLPKNKTRILPKKMKTPLYAQEAPPEVRHAPLKPQALTTANKLTVRNSELFAQAKRATQLRLEVADKLDLART